MNRLRFVVAAPGFLSLPASISGQMLAAIGAVSRCRTSQMLAIEIFACMETGFVDRRQDFPVKERP